MEGSSEKELRILWRVRRTLWEMLNDRGFAVSKSDMDMSYDQFKILFEGKSRAAMDIYVDKTLKTEEKKSDIDGDSMQTDGEGNGAGMTDALQSAASDDDAKKLIVFFAEEEKLGVKSVQTYVERMRQDSIYHAIIVLQKGITAFAKRALAEVSNPSKIGAKKRYFQCFEQEELMVNITKHVFVPKHELLSNKEKDELLNRYKLKEAQLPRMQAVDPIARYFGLVRGQVLKITRPSETAGRYVTYRIVL